MKLVKTSFSVFLLRAAAQEEVFRLLFAGANPLAAGLDGTFVAIPSTRLPPKWLAAVRPFLTESDANFNLFTESPAGMMFVRRGGRAFVITFGHAWQQLKLEWLELDFGRRVALNAVPPDKLLEVNTEQVFAKWHLARERAPKATSVREFALEHDRDLVAALEGIPSEPVLGGTVRGSISLRLSIEFPTVANALDRAAALFVSDDYKRKWPEIDNVVPVSDISVVNDLDALLDADLRSGVARRHAVMFSPYFRHGDALAAESYVFGRLHTGQARSPYLLYGSWEMFLSKSNRAPSVESAKWTPVHLFDEAGESFERRTVYECLGYELSKDARQCFLSSGIWYEAADDFVVTVNRSINSLKGSSVELPQWDGALSEGEYNKLCCTNKDFLHFDARNIHFGGGQSKFEFCDFMHLKQKTLFFAKIPTRSSDCSHLVEQVRRTVELLFGLDSQFRKKLKQVMRKHHPKASADWLDRRPLPGDWNLCLVSLGKDKKNLPLFAKCGLRRLVNSLQQIGHPVLFESV
jgi:uncharacterized protein (TIGR04141 family)